MWHDAQIQNGFQVCYQNMIIPNETVSSGIMWFWFFFIMSKIKHFYIFESYLYWLLIEFSVHILCVFYCVHGYIMFTFQMHLTMREFSPFYVIWITNIFSSFLLSFLCTFFLHAGLQKVYEGITFILWCLDIVSDLFTPIL